MASIHVAENQSLFDIAIQRLGSTEAVFELAILNGLSITDELAAGSLIDLPEAWNKSSVADYFKNKNLVPATFQESAGSQIENIQVIYWTNDFEEKTGMRVSERQSMFDVAMQTSGSFEAVFELALLNGISITDELVAGQLLQLPAVLNSDNVNYYALKKIVPETVGTEIDESLPVLEGIGYWAIGVDFVVS